MPSNSLSGPNALSLYLDVLQPVSGLQTGEPVRLLHVGVNNVFQLLQWLPHHMDVVDIQENKLSILIGIFTFITPSCGLGFKTDGSKVKEDMHSARLHTAAHYLYRWN